MPDGARLASPSGQRQYTSYGANEGTPRRNTGLTLQQQLADRFEDFLFEHMTKLGMKCTHKPVLGDGKTPDFLAEHWGRTCYVEATHIHPHPAFRVMKGELDLKNFLNEQLPQDRGLVLSYEADDAQDRLTDPLSRKDGGVREIARWARGEELETEGQRCTRVFFISDIAIQAQLFQDSAERPERVGWSRGYSSWGNPGEPVRKSLRAKYGKYTASPGSLGETPLVIAILDVERLKSEMGQALYGTTNTYVTLVRGPTPSVQPRVERIHDGVWLNRRSGKLERRHHHLAGVWHFQSLGDDPGYRCLFPNPFREDLDSIIPTPILCDRAF